MEKLNTDLEPYRVVPNWNEAPEGTTHAEYIEPCSLTEGDPNRQLWEWYKYDGTNNFYWRDGWQRDTLFSDVGFSETVRVRPLSEYLLWKLGKGTVWNYLSIRKYTILTLTNLESTNPSGFPYTVVYKDSDGRVWSKSVYEWMDKFTYDSSYEENLADEAEKLAKVLCVRDGKDVDDCYDTFDRGDYNAEPHITYVWEHYLQDAYNFLELKRELNY